MSFQAVGPEEPKERSPKLVVQYRGTSSLFDMLHKMLVTPRRLTVKSMPPGASPGLNCGVDNRPNL